MLKIRKTIACAGLAAGMWAIAGAASAAVIFTSGFEAGPDVATTSFPQSPSALEWQASNTDGERIKSAGAKLAYEGDFYASLLQNAGAYGGATAIGSFGSTGYDRIYNTFAVNPNSTYVVSFAHAGDDRFGYTADTSIVDVVSMDNGAVFANLSFATPDLFNWTVESFMFTTDALTTSVALAFTVAGLGNTSGVFDDIIVSEFMPNGEIPVPGAFFLMLGGLGALRMRMKKKAAA